MSFRIQPNEALSCDRYLNSADFAELNAISGMAVASRCRRGSWAEVRELLWFLQAISLEPEGLKRLAGNIVAMFPDRFVPCAPWKCAMKWADLEDEHKDLTRDQCIDIALHRSSCQREDERGPTTISFEEFFVDLCVNPRLRIPLPGECPELVANEVNAMYREFPELDKWQFSDAGLVYFKDIIGALAKYKQRYEERIKADFCSTAISNQVWRQLDNALKTRTMVVVEGLEGRGKTEAVQAWCKCHLGVARFVSLDGTSTKTAQFREVARALGIRHRSRNISVMQAEIKEVLRTSGLMLVIDEAHFLFSQALHGHGRPELLDWIDTAICNPSSPVALICTPQFMDCMERAVRLAEWNFRQFKRRCKRYCRLPAKNTPEDVEAVARHLLPKADRATFKQILAYEALSKRDLSAVGDVVREAKLMAEQEGAAKVTFEHVKRAIHEVLLVSDLPWAEMEKRLRDQKPGRRALPEAPALAPEPTQERVETGERDVNPRLSSGAVSGSRLRFHAADPALETAEDLPALSPV